MQPTELCPWVVTAIIKGQASCPKSKCDGNIARLITQADIKSLLGKRKADMLQAEAILAECRAMTSGLALNPDTVVRTLGKLDVSMCKMLLGKEQQKHGSSPQDIAKAFAVDLGIAPKDPPSEDAASSSRTEAPLAGGIVQYDEHGRPTEVESMVLHQKGFAKGIVVESGGSIKGTIVRIDADGTVELEHEGQTKTVDYVTFKDNYKQRGASTTAANEFIPDWEKFRPMKMQNEVLMKAQIVIAIASMAQDDCTDLKIQVKPMKSVYVTKDIAARKLILTPESSRIMFETHRDGLNGRVGSQQYRLLPQFSVSKHVVAAWAVREADDNHGANMIVQYKKVMVQAGEVTIEVVVPFLLNTKKLHGGDELFLDKVKASTESSSDQAKKKAKKG
jgi:hypothetical protein